MGYVCSDEVAVVCSVAGMLVGIERCFRLQYVDYNIYVSKVDFLVM